MSTFARRRIGTMIQSADAATGNAEIVRQNNGVLAGAEHRCLLWLADRMPSWVHPDHLTFIALAAMLLAGISCAWARAWPPALPLTTVWLAVNWFGDSLDGTLARVRKQERPRYGYYVDHMSDSFGVLFLFGGLACSGYLSPLVALSLLVIYLLLAINSYLAAYSLGIFQMSFWKVGPTELRILLSIGFVVAWQRPTVCVLGTDHLFLDVASVVAMVAMTTTLVVSVAQNTMRLYLEERI